MIRLPTHSAKSVGLVVTILLWGACGLVVTTGVATAQTADYDPSNPYLGMEVVASDSQIQDGQFYNLRAVDSFDDGTVNTHNSVKELEADGTEITVETKSLEPDTNYFITGPGLNSPTSLTEEQTFELREQTLEAGFGDDSEHTNDSIGHNHTDTDSA